MVFAARLALLSMMLTVPAQAQDEEVIARSGVEVDTNVICDTQQQMERFVALLDGNQGNAEAAMAAVSAEHGTVDACVIATAAFRRGVPVSTVKGPTTDFDVTPITVVAVYTIGGPERSPPTQFFTLYPHDDQAGTTVGSGERDR